VASRQAERHAWLAEFDNEDDWEEVIRTPSPRNPGQKKSHVHIKRRQKGNEVYLLCLSEGREAKDRAIREKHERQLQQDLQALPTRIEKGQLQATAKIHQAVGRLQERYPRVARYYRMVTSSRSTSPGKKTSTRKPPRKNWMAAMCARAIARI